MGVQAEVYPLIKIQPPLSRRGIGPGLIIVSGRNLQDSLADNAVTQTLDPQPRKKWAEEGYTVADVRVDNVLSPQRAYEIKQQLVEAVERLGQVKECQGEEVGLVDMLHPTRIITIGKLTNHILVS
ncbi:hypothetical protein QBC40DRAFT_188920 [Triangularia verruculosa]|uniref:Uncharacterized protein n=1 Tax=Triangularia verruculosa TaxID=2587418 RepID=A0AAN6X4W9_9PEZI|nr:hypothetical protein QBC40DRAFT_188920 [Triangularia verruculosa]